MAVREVLAEKKSHGSGTPVSGYVDTPTPKKCGTCEYLVRQRLCKQKTVLKDPKLKTDPKSRLKIVSAENGCCDFWTPDEA